MLTEQDLLGRLAFLQSVEPLKSTLRSSNLADGRRESTADHTWRLGLWVLAFADQRPDLDSLKMLKIALIHDLGEAIYGDTPAPEQQPSDDKATRERAGLTTLLVSLPAALADELMKLWDEYDTKSSPEGAFVRGLDKLETILQHNQGLNGPDFNYAFNLGYGIKHTHDGSLLSQLRATLDHTTHARVRAQTVAQAATQTD
jgi:putative hydrolase of HD superfamily